MRLAVILLIASTIAASAQEAPVPILPDLAKTPGPASLDQEKVCAGRSTQPLRKKSKADRRCVLSRYGKPSYAFTYDHLVPLELGGTDGCDNLWPQPRGEARRKDRLEDALYAHVCVCQPGIPLAKAQDMIRRNWLAAYARYVTPKGSKMCAVNAVPGS